MNTDGKDTEKRREKDRQKNKTKERNKTTVTIGKIHTQTHRHRQTKEQNAGFVGWETGLAAMSASPLSSPATVPRQQFRKTPTPRYPRVIRPDWRIVLRACDGTAGHQRPG